MLAKTQYADLPEYREPAVCRLSLASVVLTSLSTGQVERFTAASSFMQELPTQPPQEDLKKDLALLEALGLTADGYLTNLKKRASEMQVEPEVVVILLAGAMLGVGKSCAFIATAAMSEHLLELLTKNKKKCNGYNRAGAFMSHVATSSF